MRKQLKENDLSDNHFFVYSSISKSFSVEGGIPEKIILVMVE